MQRAHAYLSLAGITVERVLADIMLGFFFPGAELGAAEADRT